MLRFGLKVNMTENGFHSSYLDILDTNPAQTQIRNRTKALAFLLLVQMRE